MTARQDLDGFAPEAFLRGLFDRAVAVADPMRSLAKHLPERPKGRLLVIGAGKASARMAEAVEAAWGPCEGLVITRTGYARPCQRIEIVEAAHPVPDAAGQAATARLLALVAGFAADAGPDDLVLALISGGASALLVQPVAGISLADKQAVNAGLLASGAPIAVMNTLRKHLSRVKGGQLAAAAYPARLEALMISDVPGDDPAYIGSGPTVGERSTPQQALAVLRDWQVDLPAPVLARVKAALVGPSGVVGPDDPRLSRTHNRIIAAPAQSLAAAAQMAAGCEVRLLGDALEGEAREVAAAHARLALAAAGDMVPGDRPILILSGGELTVTRRGSGIGGPNSEYALALAIGLAGHPRIHALACDTDGVDGAAEVAGAVLGPHTLARAATLGLDPAAALDRNDAHSFFAAVSGQGGAGQVVTGPTLTNVNDFRAVLVLPPGTD